MDGAEELIISMEPSLSYHNETGLFIIEINKNKCSKFFEGDHTGYGINTFSAIINIFQRITTKHDLRQAFDFVLYYRLPPRPTKIRNKIKGRPVTDASTEQELVNEF